MKENIVLNKSYDFAVNVLKAVKVLERSIENYVFVKQLIRSATSVGANLQESQGGLTKKEFIHKLNISYREAKESKYWIKLIIDSQLKNKPQEESFLKLYNDGDEICKIIYTIIKSSKQ
jgi:four helix bundle protein